MLKSINDKGFTLVEIIVVMAIFMVVLSLASNSFTLIQKQVASQSLQAQSNIDGVIGLEILRSDLESAGYGLPWNVPTSITYKEADATNPQLTYNQTSGAPVAVQSGDNVTAYTNDIQLSGTDYLVLRATNLATSSPTAQHWSYMTRQMVFDTVSSALPTSYANRVNTWQSASNNLTSSDRIVVITGTDDKDPNNYRRLITSGSSTFFTTYSPSTLANFQPDIPTMPPIPHALTVDSSPYYIYGVSDSQDLIRPHNRADYFVRRPTSGANQMPKRCAPNTGILFKGVLTHDAAGGKLLPDSLLPLLDCVADFQVVYDIDSLNNGSITEGSASILSPLSASDIRNQLKSIQVYILTHDGRKDTGFTYPNATIGVGPGDGTTSGTGHTFNLAATIGTGWQNYRWKVYRIIVTPKNLFPAQK